MRPVSTRRGRAFCRAANDNWPIHRVVSIAHEWPPRPAAEAKGAVPEWLLRGLMILACSAPLAALLLALPWIRQFLDG